MSTFNQIYYTVMSVAVPTSRLPIATISSDQVAYGSVLLKLPLTSCSVSASVYRLAPPTSSEDRWGRLQPELLHTYPDALAFTTTLQSDGYYRIDWEFQPDAIPSVFTGQYFSIEFAVNASMTATVASYAPKIIVEIKNDIDFTGVTGYAGITGLSSVYMGETGAAGNTGLQGPTGVQGPQGQTGVIGFGGTTGSPGEQGITGYQGLTGYKGITGIPGLPGLGATGVQGNTGIQGKGETGLQGLTGLSGVTGVVGVTGTGPQGVTGFQGSTGLENFYEQANYTGPSLQPAVMWQTVDDTQFIRVPDQDAWIQVSSAMGQGDTGVRGPTGYMGVTGTVGAGVTGLVGVTGFQGVTGLQNFYSATYSTPALVPAHLFETNDEATFFWVTSINAWVQSSAGAMQGGTGYRGATGVQGCTGVQGVTGTAGLTGLSGVTGLRGLTGVQGIQGQTGIGAQGTQGSTGVQGQGVTGLIGVTGFLGLTGIQGQTGVQGSTGAVGAGSTGLIGITKDSFNGYYENPVNKVYTIDSYAPASYTINSLSVKCYTGSGNCDVLRNGIGITGLFGLAFSKTRLNATATGNILISAGDTITMNLYNVNTVLNYEYTLAISR